MDHFGHRARLVTRFREVRRNTSSYVAEALLAGTRHVRSDGDQCSGPARTEAVDAARRWPAVDASSTANLIIAVLTSSAGTECLHRTGWSWQSAAGR